MAKCIHVNKASTVILPLQICVQSYFIYAYKGHRGYCSLNSPTRLQHIHLFVIGTPH